MLSKTDLQSSSVLCLWEEDSVEDSNFPLPLRDKNRVLLSGSFSLYSIFFELVQESPSVRRLRLPLLQEATEACIFIIIHIYFLNVYCCYSPVHAVEQICVSTLWQTKHHSQQGDEPLSQKPSIGMTWLWKSFLCIYIERDLLILLNKNEQIKDQLHHQEVRYKPQYLLNY